MKKPAWVKPCVKCLNDDVSVAFHTGKEFECDGNVLGAGGCPDSLRHNEHLRLNCRMCGFFWFANTQDSPAKEPQTHGKNRLDEKER